MTDEKHDVPKVNMASTKKEMLTAYRDLLKRLEEKGTAEMKPEQKIAKKQEEEAVAVADSLSIEGIARDIGVLKSEIGKTLTQLSDRLEGETDKYDRVKKAVEIREKELQEIYEIEKAASTLAALVEAQKERREKFEADMAAKKEDLEKEIETTREQWIVEETAHAAEVKARALALKKEREREAEEYKYSFDREKRLAEEEFKYEKAKLERDLEMKQEEMQKDILVREKAIGEKEAELERLRSEVDRFPKELDAAVSKAVKETKDALNKEAKAREELLENQFQGEQNVLTARIESLQQTVKEQNAQITKMSAQIEKSYSQVQDIAVKAIEGSSNTKTYVSMSPSASEQASHPGKAEK